MNGDAAWSLWNAEDLATIKASLFATSVVAIGTFDGVHLGHRRILQEAASMGEEAGWTPIALTFDRHPSAFLQPGKEPPQLTSFDERVRRMLETGVRHVVAVRFDGALARYEAGAFLRDVIQRALGARGIVVGQDFRFGHRAQGDARFLSDEAPSLGMTLKIVPPVRHQDEQVSSTRIRRLIEEGDVARAAALLGRWHVLEGRVVQGERLGRRLGFPTANLACPPALALPKDGVYVVEARLPWEKARQGVAAIGMRPTVGGSTRAVEVHLLDFEGDLYGKRLTVSFIKRVRGITRFQDVEQLRRQIESDVAFARKEFTRRAEMWYS